MRDFKGLGQSADHVHDEVSLADVLDGIQSWRNRRHQGMEPESPSCAIPYLGPETSSEA